MMFTLTWADGIGLHGAMDYVREGFLVCAFLAMTGFVFSKESKRTDLLFNIVCWAGCLTAVFLFVWYGLFHQLPTRLVSVGTLNSPIVAGNGFGFMALIAFFYFFLKDARSINSGIFYGSATVIAVIFVILTNSRGPLLALTTVMVICSIPVNYKKFIWVLMILVAGFSAVWAAGIFDFTDLMNRGASYRITIWQHSLEIFQQKFWSGYGLGGQHPDILFKGGTVAPHSHNLFLSNMVDGGVFALIFLMLMLGIAFRWSCRYFYNSKDITLVALILFSVCANLTDGKTLIVSPNYQWLYFWLPLSLTSAYELRWRKKTEGSINR